MTTKKAQTELLARRRQMIGREYTDEYGSVVKLTAYDAESDVYTSLSGCRWKVSPDGLAAVYGADFIAEEAANREKVGL